MLNVSRLLDSKDSNFPVIIIVDLHPLQFSFNIHSNTNEVVSVHENNETKWMKFGLNVCSKLNLFQRKARLRALIILNYYLWFLIRLHKWSLCQVKLFSIFFTERGKCLYLPTKRLSCEEWSNEQWNFFADDTYRIFSDGFSRVMVKDKDYV